VVRSQWRPAPNLPSTGIVAHRGATLHHPENTLPALREAVRLGAAQIEFDVRGTADRKLVVIHDATVDRTTDGRGSVSGLPLAELRRLDAGRWKHARFAGERLPTLEEVLDAMPRDRWLNVNIKGAPWVAVEAARQLRDRGRLDQSLLAVGEDGAAAARAAVPEAWICHIDRKMTRRAYIDAALSFGANFVQLHHARGEPHADDLERLHEAGVRINYCCVDTVDEAGALIESGVDFPLVDQLTDAAAGWLAMEPLLAPPAPSPRTPVPAAVPARRE
jgi:glycerophosphoryl diester phosphodiesterase